MDVREKEDQALDEALKKSWIEKLGSWLLLAGVVLVVVGIVLCLTGMVPQGSALLAVALIGVWIGSVIGTAAQKKREPETEEPETEEPESERPNTGSSKEINNQEILK